LPGPGFGDLARERDEFAGVGVQPGGVRDGEGHGLFRHASRRRAVQRRDEPAAERLAVVRAHAGTDADEPVAAFDQPPVVAPVHPPRADRVPPPRGGDAGERVLRERAVQFGPQGSELVVDAAVASPHPHRRQSHAGGRVADSAQEHEDAEDDKPAPCGKQRS
jgi:hypothetical protein